MWSSMVVSISGKLRGLLTAVRRLYKIELWEWVLLMVYMASPASMLRIMRMAYALKHYEVKPFAQLTFEPGEFAPHSPQIALALSGLELRNLIRCERRKVVKVLRRGGGVEWREDRVCEITEDGIRAARQIKRWAWFKDTYFYVKCIAQTPVKLLNALIYAEARHYISRRYKPRLTFIELLSRLSSR
ncbi:MAG: hypothetical protein ACPL3C_09905 [Pyrobaculum sp.]